MVVNAAWLDYEGLPFQSNYSDAIGSLNGPEFLPDESIRSPKAFTRYTRQVWISLVSTYIAAPIREVYPRISVTNTNPVAYGIDTAFNARAKLNGMSTQRDVDRIYTEILLSQVSADSNEMFTYEEFLLSGTVLNYRYRISNQKPVLWTGMKLENQTIIRATSLSGELESVTVDPWSDSEITLQAPISGVTYFLFRGPMQQTRIQRLR